MEYRDLENFFFWKFVLGLKFFLDRFLSFFFLKGGFLFCFVCFLGLLYLGEDCFNYMVEGWLRAVLENDLGILKKVFEGKFILRNFYLKR